MSKIKKKNKAVMWREERMICNYLAGSEFQGRLKAITDVFAEMTRSLDKEKKAMERIWADRERQIHDVASSMSMLCGEIGGITAAAGKDIK